MKNPMGRCSVGILLAIGLLLASRAGAANPQVELKTSQGPIIIELYSDRAPKTVDNFLQYVREGFYDGTLFHRVISGFMVQGGGFTPDFKHKPTREPVMSEAGNGLKNERGTVAMARTGNPHSATAQFFINVVDNPFLNFTGPTAEGYGYTVFGKVVKGMDVVDKIAASPTGAAGPFRSDVPKQPIIIEKASAVPAR